MGKGAVIIGGAIGLAGIWLLTRTAAGKEGIDLQAGVYTGPLRYTGPTKTFKAALGECYDVIYAIDVWDDYYKEYLPPVDPVHDKIEKGTLCYVQARSPCTLYNFERE